MREDVKASRSSKCEREPFPSRSASKKHLARAVRFAYGQNASTHGQTNFLHGMLRDLAYKRETKHIKCAVIVALPGLPRHGLRGVDAPVAVHAEVPRMGSVDEHRAHTDASVRPVRCSNCRAPHAACFLSGFHCQKYERTYLDRKWSALLEGSRPLFWREHRLVHFSPAYKHIQIE